MDARSLDRDDVLLAATRQPALQNSPGAEFNYNNTAFSLAAQIVEKTSGLDFDEYMRENVDGSRRPGRCRGGRRDLLVG